MHDVAREILDCMASPVVAAQAAATLRACIDRGLCSDWDPCPEKTRDFAALVIAASCILSHGGSIETGVYRGGTSGVLIRHDAPDTFHVSIDPFGLPGQSYPQSREYLEWDKARTTLSRLAALAEESRVTHCHYAMSASAFIKGDLLTHPAAFRLVHLDGDHSEREVINELTYFRSRIRTPAVFILDDHDEHWPGVGRALKGRAGRGLLPIFHRYYDFPDYETPGVSEPCGFSAWLHLGCID